MLTLASGSDCQLNCESRCPGDTHSGCQSGDSDYYSCVQRNQAQKQVSHLLAASSKASSTADATCSRASLPAMYGTVPEGMCSGCRFVRCCLDLFSRKQPARHHCCSDGNFCCCVGPNSFACCDLDDVVDRVERCLLCVAALRPCVDQWISKAAQGRKSRTPRMQMFIKTVQQPYDC